jgi:2-C-methyl-D-erythritol 4-phosphate cytidylyltransferase
MSPNSDSASPNDVGVILAAAGRGERVGGQGRKQLRAIAGVPMLLRAVRPFAQHARVREIVTVLPADVVADPPEWLRDIQGGRVRLVEGGETRTASVFRGVNALSASCAIILIHDAARPFVRLDTIDAIIERVASGVSAIAAIPVSDTLKQADESETSVANTVDRRGLWRAQTPQGFPRDVLQRVYAQGALTSVGAAATDEATLVERAGFPVSLVLDSAVNIKVTTPEDFLIAEALATQ